jgi:hypothetical protein
MNGKVDCLSFLLEKGADPSHFNHTRVYEFMNMTIFDNYHNKLDCIEMIMKTGKSNITQELFEKLVSSYT